ncbi:hypothetical protein ACUXCC_004129 [Cytobacillus horneckiae]|uniref:hypothetical protein n=1 Tax=Cytobacillus horneckiae TaxID=549687 RepID=UPI0019D12A6C|nr:hypothetical protein [Cytobacillus horneckiae]
MITRLPPTLLYISFNKLASLRQYSLEFLHTPIDVIKYRCFGQSPQMIQAVIAESFQEVTHLFDRYSSKKGLAVTFSRYIVNIKV